MGPKRDNPGSRRGGGRPPRRKIDVAQTPVPERERLFSECSEDQCSVCWNDIKIFAVGFCNHTVCYQCIARMRVLCAQNECAICRQDMPKVILTHSRCNYAEFGDKVMLMERRNQICFEDEKIKKAYEELLQYVCPVCQKDQPVIFRTFKQLDQHVRREHELFYCDLCSDHLKVTTVTVDYFAYFLCISSLKLFKIQGEIVKFQAEITEFQAEIVKFEAEVVKFQAKTIKFDPKRSNVWVF